MSKWVNIEELRAPGMRRLLEGFAVAGQEMSESTRRPPAADNLSAMPVAPREPPSAGADTQLRAA